MSLKNRMKKIRLAYGASCTNMSALLGLGINSWANYESGKQIPNESNKILITMSLHPHTMMSILRQYPAQTNRIKKSKYVKIRTNVVKINGDIDQKSGDYRIKLFKKWEKQLT